MLRQAGIIIRHTINIWRERLQRIAAEWCPVASGDLSLDDFKPWRIIDGTERPALFIPVPRAVRELGDEATQQFVIMTEAYSRYKSQFGDPFLTGEPFTMLNTSDPLTEWTFAERVDVLEQCHLAWERNPDANAAVTYNRLFSVGGGMQRVYRNKDVEAALEAFCGNEENVFVELEKSLMDTLQVDGELFMRLHGDKNAEDIIMTPVPAWGIQRIKHEPGFIRRVESYEYIITEDDGMGKVETRNDTIQAEDMIHVAINRKAYELRGRPELFKVLVWLNANKSYLEDRARQNHYRGSLLWDVTLMNASAAQVSAKRQQYKTPPAGQAAIAIHNDKEVWQKFSDDINAGGATEDGRQMRLKVSTGMRLPEYFLSDGSMSNLATAKAQALPAIMSFLDWQDIARERIFAPLFRKVLERVGMDLDQEVPVHDGETGEETGDKVKVRDAFEIKYRSLEDTEPINVLQALQIAVTSEWMSNETAAGLMPFDVEYNKEVDKIAAEREREMDEMSKGLRMPPPQFAFGPQSQEDEGDDKNNGSNGNQRDEDTEPEKATDAA